MIIDILILVIMLATSCLCFWNSIQEFVEVAHYIKTKRRPTHD